MREEMARITGTEAAQWFAVFKARYAMRAVCRALPWWNPGVGSGEAGDSRVLTILYTCCTAVDPIISAGLTPVYADINPDTLTLDTTGVSDSLGRGLKALVLQNTFGFISPAATREARGFADANRLLYLEDSAHCVGRMARDRAGNPLADVSVHSFGVEKILPGTRFGGMVWVNPRLVRREPGFYKSLTDSLRSFAPLPWLQAVAVRLYLNELRVLSRLPQPVSGGLRRGLRRLRLFEPPISPGELRAGLEYPDFTINANIARKALHDLGELGANQRQREAAARVYRSRLLGLERVRVPGEVAGSPAQPMLVFPVVLENERVVDGVYRRLRGLGVYPRRWYRTILFPGVESLDLYQVGRAEDYPHTMALTGRVLGLPTDVSVGRARAVSDVVAGLDGE